MSTAGTPLIADPPIRPSAHPPVEVRWTRIALADIAEPTLRRALDDLLRLVDTEVWPRFALNDDPVVIVDSRDSARQTAYCIGRYAPPLQQDGSISRLWRTEAVHDVPAGKFEFTSRRGWGLGDEGELVAVGFSGREQTVATALHEHFHLHFQSRYEKAFGDDIEGSAPPSGATRQELAQRYARALLPELRTECTALVAALQAGSRNRTEALDALRRFIAARDQRRSREGAPSFEEDFWERQEGIPTNVERRAAAHLQFDDPSIIAAIVKDDCKALLDAGYFLVLGALQAAVLDEVANPLWPHRVYPTDGSRASSLYSLIRSLANESN